MEKNDEEGKRRDNFKNKLKITIHVVVITFLILLKMEKITLLQPILSKQINHKLYSIMRLYFIVGYNNEI